MPNRILIGSSISVKVFSRVWIEKLTSLIEPWEAVFTGFRLNKVRFGSKFEADSVSTSPVRRASCF